MKVRRNTLDDRRQAILVTLDEYQYDYIKPLGHGGFGSVHLVRSRKYNQNFAAKLIKQSRSHNVKAEIDTLKKLTRSYILKLYEYFEDANYLYIILEYCPGGSLEEYIKANGPIPKHQLFRLCSCLLQALQLCHERNIAHRDIKPGNILIDANYIPKLADFGLSQSYIDEKMESTSFAGSKLYMAPEIVSKTKYDPFSADIWALGLTFYYFAFGRLPWIESDEKGIEMQIKIGAVDIPSRPCYEPEFISALKRMLNVSPKGRAKVDWLLSIPIFQNTQTSINLFSIYDPNPDSRKAKSRIGAIMYFTQLQKKSSTNDLLETFDEQNQAQVNLPRPKIPRILSTKARRRFIDPTNL